MVEIEFGDEKEKQEDEENEIDAERSKQESGEEFDESSASSSEEPGGLVGLISNLSGVKAIWHEFWFKWFFNVEFNFRVMKDLMLVLYLVKL